MRVIEAVTDEPVCGHCRRPWRVLGAYGNDCCAEDREETPASCCTIDRQPCYVGKGTMDAHYRCGTVQCGAKSPVDPKEIGL